MGPLPIQVSFWRQAVSPYSYRNEPKNSAIADQQRRLRIDIAASAADIPYSATKGLPAAYQTQFRVTLLPSSSRTTQEELPFEHGVLANPAHGFEIVPVSLARAPHPQLPPQYWKPGCAAVVWPPDVIE